MSAPPAHLDWPEPLRRIILMCSPHEMPERAWLNKWEPDAAKADALYDRFVFTLEEKKADVIGCSDAIGLPCKDEAEAHFFAMSSIISQAKHDQGRATEKAARAVQAKAASKKPRSRKSPFPAWMNEAAIELAKKHPTYTPNRLAVSAIDAITTEARNLGNLDHKLPSRATIMEWIRAVRAE